MLVQAASWHLRVARVFASAAGLGLALDLAEREEERGGGSVGSGWYVSLPRQEGTPELVAVQSASSSSSVADLSIVGELVERSLEPRLFLFSAMLWNSLVEVSESTHCPLMLYGANRVIVGISKLWRLPVGSVLVSPRCRDQVFLKATAKGAPKREGEGTPPPKHVPRKSDGLVSAGEKNNKRRWRWSVCNTMLPAHTHRELTCSQSSTLVFPFSASVA